MDSIAARGRTRVDLVRLLEDMARPSRNGTALGVVAGSATGFIDATTAPSTAYTYTVARCCRPRYLVTIQQNWVEMVRQRSVVTGHA